MPDGLVCCRGVGGLCDRVAFGRARSRTARAVKSTPLLDLAAGKHAFEQGAQRLSSFRLSCQMFAGGSFHSCADTPSVGGDGCLCASSFRLWNAAMSSISKNATDA